MLGSDAELSRCGIEVWQPIPISGFIGYEASNLGRIKSLARWGGREYKQWRKERILKAAIDKDGYHRVGLSDQGKTKHFRVHNLVLMAFDRSKPPKKQGRHLDGNPGNNRLYNICWGTSKQNGRDKIVHGTVARGEKNGGGKKLSEKQVIEIFKAAGLHRSIAKSYGISQVLVSAIKRRKAWKHVTL